MSNNSNNSNTKTEAEVKTVHFTVDPNGIMSLVRQMWFGERKCAKALDILMGGFGVSLEQALSLIKGDTKLISEDGCNFDLAPDKPVVVEGPRGIQASWDGLMKRLTELEGLENKLRELEQYKPIIWASYSERRGRNGLRVFGSPAGYVSAQVAIDFLAGRLGEPEDEEWAVFWQKHLQEVRDTQENVNNFDDEIKYNPKTAFTDAEKEVNMKEQLEILTGKDKKDKNIKTTDNVPRKSSGWSKYTSTDVDVYLAHEKELETMPAPKPDRTFKSGDGWITPDGKFYPCRYMEHIWAAHKIAGLEEKDAEKRGWIKLSDNIAMGKKVYEGGKKPTQKQRDTLFDWCNAQKVDYPDWAKE